MYLHYNLALWSISFLQWGRGFWLQTRTCRVRTFWPASQNCQVEYTHKTPAYKKTKHAIFHCLIFVEKKIIKQIWKSFCLSTKKVQVHDFWTSLEIHKRCFFQICWSKYGDIVFLLTFKKEKNIPFCLCCWVKFSLEGWLLFTGKEPHKIPQWTANDPQALHWAPAEDNDLFFSFCQRLVH